MMKSVLVVLILSLVAGQQCDFPNLSQGNFKLTHKSITKFKARNPLFVLAVSDSSCAECCFSERLLHNFITSADRPVPVARVDKHTETKLLRQEYLPMDAPALYVYLEESGFYKYTISSKDIDGDTTRFANYLSRLTEPLLPLDSISAVEHFMSLDFANYLGVTNDSQLKYHTRALALITDV